MPRIIITTHPRALATGEAPVLLDEYVSAVHLSNGHAALQLIERLGWAIADAEQAESAEARDGVDMPAPAEHVGARAHEPHPPRTGSRPYRRPRSKRAVVGFVGA